MKISISQLIKKSRLLIGKTPGKYLQEIRLNKARELLNKSEEPIKNVAYSCGFSSYSVFWHAFRKRFHQTPGYYVPEKTNYPEVTISWTFPPNEQMVDSLESLVQNHDWLEHFLKFVMDRLGDNQLNVKDIANEMCFSVSKFSRLVKKVMGIGPMRFIRHLRLLYAEELMQQKSTLSKTAIAYQAGFSDQAHLCFSFKTHFGTSPHKHLKNKDAQLCFYSKIKSLAWKEKLG